MSCGRLLRSYCTLLERLRGGPVEGAPAGADQEVKKQEIAIGDVKSMYIRSRKA